MASGAMLADLAATPTIIVMEREVELFARLLARDRRIEELESERDQLQEEKAGMAGRIGQLDRHVEELTRKAGLNSTNSSKPPSSDGLRQKTEEAGRKAPLRRRHHAAHLPGAQAPEGAGPAPAEAERGAGRPPGAGRSPGQGGGEAPSHCEMHSTGASRRSAASMSSSGEAEKYQ